MSTCVDKSCKKRLISDPHFHLWSPSTHSWLHDKQSLVNHPVGDLNAVAREYHITEYLNESQKYVIDTTVHVQCFHNDPILETVSLQRIADDVALSRGHPHAIIAHAELESTDIERVILEHRKNPNFRGIRQCLDYHPRHKNRRLGSRDDLMMDAAWHKGIKLLLKYGLIFDMQVYPMQLPAAAVVAACYPDLTIVLNHCGFPMLDEDEENEWEKGLALTARNRNVCVKLSGWAIVNQKFDTAYMKHVIGTIVGLFGVERCMFASDFPVDKVGAHSYDWYWDTYVQICKELKMTEADIDNMIHLNAIRIYKLQKTRSAL